MDDEYQDVRLARRCAGAQSERKALKPLAIQLLTVARNTREGLARRGPQLVELPLSVALVAVGNKAPTTVNTYAAALQRMLLWLQADGQIGIQPGPCLIPDADGVRAYLDQVLSTKRTVASTRTLCAALDFFANVAGLESPTQDFWVQALKGAISRRRGVAQAKKSPLFTDDIMVACDLRFGAPVRDIHRTGWNWEVDPWRTMCLVAKESELRFDDLFDLRLFDVLWGMHLVQLNLVHAKNDPLQTGQRASLSPTSLAAIWLERMLTAATHRLLAVDGSLLEALPLRWRTASQPLDIPPMRLWPTGNAAGANGLPPSCYYTLDHVEPAPPRGGGWPFAALPLFGRWTVDVTLGAPIRGVQRQGKATLGDGISYSRALRRVKKVAATVGLDPRRVGLHSLRRGGSVELQLSGANRELLCAALRHRSQQSTSAYISGALVQAEILSTRHDGLGTRS